MTLGAETDPARGVRAVLDVLRSSGELSAADCRGDWTAAQLAGGWSRHTYLVSDGTDRRYVVRVKPPGSLLETDLVREYRTYVELDKAKVPVPTVYGVVDRDDTAFGGPFFVMDWIDGHAPVTWRRAERAELEENWRSGSRSVAQDLVRTLAAIHAAPIGAFGFLGPPRPFEQVVGIWQETYRRQRLVRDPIVEEAFEWVAARRPHPVEPSLVHGDYRVGNTMLRNQRIAAVVDWELAYLGDPRFDLGYMSLEYLAGKFLKPGSPLLCAVADHEWFLAEYERLRGERVDRDVVRTYSALGALVLITILLTGVRMFADGKTGDVRMAWNRYALAGLRQELTQIMRW